MKSTLEVIGQKSLVPSIKQRDDDVYTVHPLLKDESEMTPHEKEALSRVRMRKANIDLLKECIDHIKETWILTEEEKGAKVEAVEKEIDDMYEAIWQSWQMYPDEVDQIKNKTKVDPEAIEAYYRRLKKKKMTSEENEMKDISKLKTDAKVSNSKIAKKLSLDDKRNTTTLKKTETSDLASKLGLKIRK